MYKRDILQEIFAIENIEDRVKKCPKISYELLLGTLSKTEFNLKAEFNVAINTVSRYTSILFPDKPKDNTKIDNWLLFKYGYRQCKSCEEVLDVEDFHSNKSDRYGIANYCKKCQIAATSINANARQSKYRASKLLRTPKWVSMQEWDEIEQFYINCPVGYQVDHIIPLQGGLVSGLHVLSNLQYLIAFENKSKHNKYVPG